MHSKVVIIGSGPAGYTAVIYAARSNLQPVMIMGQLVGGQLLYTHAIENFPGVESASGMTLIETFQKQAENLGVQMIYENVTGVDLKSYPYKITLSGSEAVEAEAVVIATGASPRWLGIPGEETYKGKGISICATCDGFFYRGKNVMVVGGGNTALYEALFLATLANKVTIVSRDKELAGEASLRDQILQDPKIEVITENVATSFEGDEKLKSVSLQNVKSSEVRTIDVDGVFVAIGQTPNSQLFTGQVEMDSNGYLITDPQTRQTSVEGVFAAGDVQESIFRQAIIACGSGAVAALGAEKYLMGKKT